MAKYGTFGYYASGDSRAKKYGDANIPSLSVAPFTATATDYDAVKLTWVNPKGTITKYRITRNQEGIPDTEEDGVILFESSTGINLPTTLIDQGNAIPLIPGRHVYYGYWVWLGADQDYRWYLAGTTYTAVPSPHEVSTYGGQSSTTYTRLMESLPRVFTSLEQNSLGEVDYSTDLAKFLNGFALTADQILTLADLLLPEETFINLSPELLNSYGVNLGLKPDTRYQDVPTKFKRKFISNALDIYASKGTPLSLQNYIESITGYAVDVSVSPNLMLSSQDATFYGGIGNWKAGSGITSITHATSGAPTTEPTATELKYRVDTAQCATVVASGSGSISNGKTAPKTNGIPVVEGESYTAFAYIKKSAGTATATITLDWYDSYGALISGSSVTSDANSLTTTWAKASLPAAAAPDGAKFAAVSINFSGAGTYSVDMVQVSLYYEADYYEARSVGVYLQPSKTNFILNPSFESGTTHWSATGATLASTSYSSNAISGQYSGAKYLTITNSGAGAVKATTSAEGAAPIGGEVTASAFYRYPTAPTGLTLSATAYEVAPYGNRVDTPTPTNSLPTGWSYTSGGTSTQTNHTSGGPFGSDAYTSWEYSAAPTSGTIVLSIGTTGMSETLVGGAAFSSSIWVKVSSQITITPSITWTTTGDPVVDDGEPQVVNANEWTNVTFTTQADFDATAATVKWTVANATGITSLGVSTATFEPVTYTASKVLTGNVDTWYRGNVSLTIPQDAVLSPFASGFNVDVSLAYTPGSTLLVDAVQLEVGSAPTDYFDGSSYNANWYGGIDNASDAPSNMYSNKDAKLARINSTIQNYLPLGTPFYIETTAGVEYGGNFKDFA